jgi:ABC-type dipeptide/oligopeptide/nickel transport system permease component
MRSRLSHALLSVLATVLIGGFAAATLVRLAPGYGVDSGELDPRLSSETIQKMRERSKPDRGLLTYYARYLANAVSGELGFSEGFRRPAAELIAERFPATARAAGMGLACGWMLGLLAALVTVAVARPAFDLLAGAITAFLLCLPSSVMALIFVQGGHAGGEIVAGGILSLVIFPRVLRFARGILGNIAGAPHVLQARAKGLPTLRIICMHVLRPAMPQILALLGVSASVAFGAAIPVEVICDSPGLGQLAWQAALKRDLPLLIDITLLVTIVTGLSGLAAEVIGVQPAVRDTA